MRIYHFFAYVYLFFISKVRTNLIREIFRFFVSDHFPKFVLLLNYSLPNFSQHFLFGTFCFNIFSLHREAGQDGACTLYKREAEQEADRTVGWSYFNCSAIFRQMETLMPIFELNSKKSANFFI